MIKCAECKYANYRPIPDKQIGHEGRLIDNWECNHPEKIIRIKSRGKGWSDKCKAFDPID